MRFSRLSDSGSYILIIITIIADKFTIFFDKKIRDCV